MCTNQVFTRMDTLKVPQRTDIQRGQIRSKSLENLTNIASGKHEKSIYGHSLSPHTNVFQGLKKRVIEGLKLSRSNQDVTGSGSVDENRKHLFVQSNSPSFEMEKRQRDEKSKSSLRLDGRKRSRTLVDGNQHGGGSHTQTPSHEPLSNQTSLGDSNISRARSFTGESNDQFVVVDTLSIDGSVDGNVGPYDAYDETDGASGAPDNERVNHEIEKLKQKINKTKKQLVEMQNTKADNVQEFLESANQKNKVNFEKRQQKTNANIQQMQKKLDKYQKVLKDLEERGVSQHRAKEMFRGVHVAVKAGASSISEVVAKPIESMNKLIKKDRRVGSADNLGTTIGTGILGEGSSTHIDETEQGFLNCSDDDTSSVSSIPNIPFNLSGSLTGNSIHPSCTVEIERLQNQNNEILLLRKENEELRETVHKLKEQLEIMAEDERDRNEYLQTQIRDLCNQYNDLTELHQQEVMEIKEEIYKANDKIDCVDYRSAERAAEIEDLIDSFSTSVKKIGTLHENEQQPFLDGYVEGNGTAKILISKVLSLVVSLFAIVLVIISLSARVISPFVSTWKRAVLSFSSALLIFILWRSTDRPILQQLHHKASDLILIAYDKQRPITVTLSTEESCDFTDQTELSKLQVRRLFEIAMPGTLSPDPYSTAMTVNDVEEKIRYATQMRCARTNEYLKDFDRLRTGFITHFQLKRCLNQHYGVSINPHEEMLLMKKYGSDRSKPGMFNYREFCIEIDKGLHDTSIQPEELKATFSSKLTKRPISPESEAKCREILLRIAPHYEYHGINIKSCYEDFDKHNIGAITESQFYRSFPGPSDVLESEMRLLARKYRNPIKNGICNYLDFHQDIIKLQKELNAAKNAQQEVKFDDEIDFGSKTKRAFDIDDIFNKILIAVHKNGIRTTEFFKDHDRLRSGVVTENQFVCGLSLCCGTQANLSRDEIQLLVHYYKLPDGRIRYKDFCDVMENAYTVPNLEKNPTATVYRPQVGELAKVPDTLSPEEEERVAAVIKGLQEIVEEKRLMLYPYFKDFDRAKCYTRSMTKTQFSRMLHMVGLDVLQTDLELLARKFNNGGDVYYPAFVQAIDSEYVGTAAMKSQSPIQGVQDPDVHEARGKSEVTSLDGLISRIRHHVLVHSLRIEEFFQDFDPLRHGSIKRSRFRMGVSGMGMSLTDNQLQVLEQHYADPKMPGNVLWKDFLLDIELVFTKRGLEKLPSFKLPPASEFALVKPGTMDWNSTTNDKIVLFDAAISRMREITKQRRVLAKPCFQDFDRHNRGYVTRSQFCQCLTSIGLSASKEEMDVIIEKFSDDTGFNYIRFLEELQPPGKTENKYIERLKELKLVNEKEIKDSGTAEMGHIMNKIKLKVVKERVRVEEFMRDYDKLRTGRLLKTIFPRAIDLCQLGLVKSEVDELMSYYQSPYNPDYVDYTRFCDDVESVFTVKGLEKNPLYEVQQFHPLPEARKNKLTDYYEDLLQAAINRLADRVRIRRIQMFPLFEDYDRVHNGSVSRSQFHRVLSELELGSLVSGREFDALYQKFDVMVGGKHDFNYVAFCDMINEYAHFEYGKP